MNKEIIDDKFGEPYKAGVSYNDVPPLKIRISHDKKPGFLQGLMRILGEAKNIGGKILNVLDKIDINSDDYYSELLMFDN